MNQRVLVTGAGGKIGRFLQRTWGAEAALWQSRTGGDGYLPWDILAQGWAGPSLEGAVIVHLAGVTTGDRLDDNAALAAAVAQTARLQGAAHLFIMSSAAVYGHGREGEVLSEVALPQPANAYGRAKLAMEVQFSGAPGITLLRLGNVAGADALLGEAGARGRVILDPVPGRLGGPARSYIGPQTLARVLARLVALGQEGKPLPAILNVAAPGPVTMASLLDAAGMDWSYGPPRDGVVPSVVLDTARLEGLMALDRADPEKMVAEWRGCGA